MRGPVNGPQGVIAHGLQPSKPPKRVHAPVRRWQRSRIGELWQMDATPHRWFPPSVTEYPLIDIIDDASRVVTGAKVYAREVLLSYLDSLPEAFMRHGLPLQVYVDKHSFFRSPDHDWDTEATTYLAETLRFYGVTFLFANTPQAKGKVERLHLFWQKRLPSLFNAEGITGPREANPLVEALRIHHNAKEIHSELGMAPDTAWRIAESEDRTTIRPAPKCPWWPYVFSLRRCIVVDSNNRVSAGTQRFRIACPAHTRIVQCLHPDGSYTFLKNQPTKDDMPRVLLRIGATPHRMP